MLQSFSGVLADLFLQHPVAQAVGCAGMVIGCASYHCRSAGRILVALCIASLFWCVHFMLLGAAMGAFLNAFIIPRNVIYSRFGKSRWADSVAWPVLFSAIFLAGLVYARLVVGESWICLIPISSMVISNFVLRSRNAQFIRWISIPISLMWLVYNAFSGSVPGVICESFNQVSLYTALFRYRARRATADQR